MSQSSRDPIKVHLSPSKNIAWRVGVRDAEGRVSQTFGIYTFRTASHPREDIYIVGRSMGGSQKVSLHASGARQVGFTDDYSKKLLLPEGRSRHFDTWDEPVRHGEGFYLEYKLRLPTNHLRPRPARAKDKDVLWISSPPAGQATELILGTSDACQTLSMEFKPRAFPAAAGKMTDGRFLVLVGRYVPALRHTNEAKLVATLRSNMEKLGLARTTTLRMLTLFRGDDGVRGWCDYSVDQLLEDAQHPITSEPPSSQ